MITIIEIGTTNYEDDNLTIKKALSHLQTACHVTDSYMISKPTSKFGWTFFQLSLKPHFNSSLENKFADMIQKYRGKNEEKFIKFMSDFFESRGAKVKLKLVQT